MVLTMAEQRLDHIGYSQWHKGETASKQSSLFGIALSWFFRFHESYKKIGLPLYLYLENNFLHKELHITYKLKLKF